MKAPTYVQFYRGLVWRFHGYVRKSVTFCTLIFPQCNLAVDRGTVFVERALHDVHHEYARVAVDQMGEEILHPGELAKTRLLLLRPIATAARPWGA